MDAFVGNISALEYWRLHDLPSEALLSQALPRTAAPDRRGLARMELENLGFQSKPIHLLVTQSAHRRSRPDVLCHVARRQPRRSFYRIAPEVYVASPEACFLHVAAQLPVIDLALVGFELCGSYAIDPYSPNGRIVNLKPRTNTAAIASFLDRVRTGKNTARARKALSFIVDGSASPRETALTLLLCLPASKGGYGLPFPKLNHPIAVEGSTNAPLRCDLCWPDHKLAFEHDSEIHHADLPKLELDSLRRSRLEAAGYHVVSVTNSQIKNTDALNKLAHIAAKRLGKRIRTSRADIDVRRAELRRKVL